MVGGVLWRGGGGGGEGVLVNVYIKDKYANKSVLGWCHFGIQRYIPFLFLSFVKFP